MSLSGLPYIGVTTTQIANRESDLTKRYGGMWFTEILEEFPCDTWEEQNTRLRYWKERVARYPELYPVWEFHTSIEKMGMPKHWNMKRV